MSLYIDRDFMPYTGDEQGEPCHLTPLTVERNDKTSMVAMDCVG